MFQNVLPVGEPDIYKMRTRKGGGVGVSTPSASISICGRQPQGIRGVQLQSRPQVDPWHPTENENKMVGYSGMLMDHNSVDITLTV